MGCAPSRASRRRSGRGAFTLVELLVVIAVIGLLVALLIPAVQASREAARRAQCVNNLRQVGLGLHSYATSYGTLPAGQGGRGQSLFVSLLPYLEQPAVYGAINFDTGVGDFATNRTATEVRLGVFLCPSDGSVWWRNGFTSYAGNLGDGLYFGGRSSGLFGAYTEPANVSVSQVTDGLSGTAAVAEWLIGAPEFPDRRRQFFRAGAAGPDQAAAACRAAAAAGAVTITANTKGSGWAVGQWSGTLYDHGLGVNETNCTYPISAPSGVLGACSAGSLHPGGANVLMGDGHARFVKDGIDPRAWRALGTRNGGEILSDPF